eukprot:258742-Rhodomonas_salina.1
MAAPPAKVGADPQQSRGAPSGPEPPRWARGRRGARALWRRGTRAHASPGTPLARPGTTPPASRPGSPTATTRAPSALTDVGKPVCTWLTVTPGAGRNSRLTFWAATERRPPSASAKAAGMASSFSRK